MEISKYVACICEGAAEQAIMKLLLDHDLLIFSYNNLLGFPIVILNLSYFQTNSN